MQTEEQLPGITLRLNKAVLLPLVPGSKFKAAACIELTASIDDFDIYQAVVEKLGEMRIYTIENLAEEMIDVVQQRAGAAKKEAHQQLEQHRIATEGYQQQLSFAQAELAAVRQENEKLHQDNATLQTCARRLGEQMQASTDVINALNRRLNRVLERTR